MPHPIPGYQRLFAELKRRRVFRVMAVYGLVAFVLLQVVSLVVPALLLPEWTYRFVAFILLLGFPVAVVLAWALELTPEGVRRTPAAASGELTEIAEAPLSKRWPAGAFALVGTAALLAGVWYAGRRSAPAAATDLAAGPVVASIAVLPFVNMSSDAEQEYFSDGISEELLNLLTKIPDLRVAARTSSFSFKGQHLKIPEIAGRLKVAHVLEGSVRKAGDRVRITAQLIRAEDGFHVWSRSWDRTLRDIFQIQDEIAADVAEQLKVTLLGAAATVEETDPDAYALFLQARQLGRRVTAEGFEQSIVLYQRALEIAPDYAAAWAGLAYNYNYQGAIGLRPIDEGYQRAREAADRALTIDPEYAEAYATLGRIAVAYDNDPAVAARHYERALELDPSNPDIINDAARLARNLDRLDRAVALQEYAVARDPVNPTSHFRLGVSYLTGGRLDEAIASFRTALRLSPGRIGAEYRIGRAFLRKGEPEAALAAMQRESSGWRWNGLALAYHALGQEAESDSALAELIARFEQEAAYNVAYILAYRGEADRAFEWLDKAVRYKDPGLSQIAVEVLFANIHDDPRWLPFLESLGKSPAQLAAIEFHVRVPQ